MEILTSDVGATIARVTLSGRLDIAGAEVIALPLATVAGAKQGLIIDMSAVSFLASIGIRALVASAKAVQQRGGKMVLVVNGGSSVLMSLEATGVDQLIPVFRNSADAERAAVA